MFNTRSEATRTHTTQILNRDDLLFEGMANILEFSIRKNKKWGGSERNSTKYKTEVVEYLQFVHKNSQLQLYCFVAAFIYLHRLVWTPPAKKGFTMFGRRGGRNPFVITRSNWMLLVTIAVMVAQKFNDDDRYLNIDFAKLCPKYNIKQLNKMEVDFLVGLNWDCSFTQQEYYAYYRWITTLAGENVLMGQT